MAKFKPLRELEGTYGSADVAKLVDFTGQSEINLPANGKYHFEIKGNTVHVYGSKGISEYEFGEASKVRTTAQGVEVGVQYEGIEKVVLHSNKNTIRTARTPKNPVSRSVSSGESRAGGESRTSKTPIRVSSGESRSGGESR